MADVDLELDSERASASLTHQTVRKNISLKLKPKTEGKSKKKDKKKSEKKASTDGEKESKKKKSSNNQETASPAVKTGNELLWNQQLLLIGQKVQDPLLHQCETCALPILVYGRMSPCKHAFCMTCADKANGKCPRCGDLVQRIETARLGHVFVCSFGGSRYGISGCRRSYLSQRDLHAHIKRRHQAEPSAAASDLSAELQADLKRPEMPAYPNPMPAVPIRLPPQGVQPEQRSFAGRPPMVNDRSMHPVMPMEAYHGRPPPGSFPPPQVPRMPAPPVAPRMTHAEQQMIQPRFDEMPRHPVSQPNVRFPGGPEAEIRPHGWMPSERDWPRPPPGEWMPPRSDPGPLPHGVRHEAPPHFNRGPPPFY